MEKETPITSWLQSRVDGEVAGDIFYSIVALQPVRDVIARRLYYNLLSSVLLTALTAKVLEKETVQKEFSTWVLRKQLEDPDAVFEWFFKCVQTYYAHGLGMLSVFKDPILLKVDLGFNPSLLCLRVRYLKGNLNMYNAVVQTNDLEYDYMTGSYHPLQNHIGFKDLLAYILSPTRIHGEVGAYEAFYKLTTCDEVDFTNLNVASMMVDVLTQVIAERITFMLGTEHASYQFITHVRDGVMISVVEYDNFLPLSSNKLMEVTGDMFPT